MYKYIYIHNIHIELVQDYEKHAECFSMIPLASNGLGLAKKDSEPLSETSSSIYDMYISFVYSIYSN